MDACKDYTLVEVVKCNFTSVGAEVKVILADMFAKRVAADDIGEPQYVKEVHPSGLLPFFCASISNASYFLVKLESEYCDPKLYFSLVNIYPFLVEHIVR
jgi:hypothetical protein